MSEPKNRSLAGIRKMNTEKLKERIAKNKLVAEFHAQQTQLDRMEQGYSSASVEKRWSRNWDVGSGTADELMLEDRALLAERGQDLYRNNPIFNGVVETLCDNVIGSGLRLQSSIDREVLNIDDEKAQKMENEIERRYHNWAKSKESDSTRQHSFYKNSIIVYRNSKIDGDVFALMPRFARGDGPIRLRIQNLPASRCNSLLLPNDDLMRDGIEFNERGEPKTYWFQRSEGYFNDPNEFVGIPAFGPKSGRRNVLHVYKPSFIGQSRGVTIAAVIMELLKQWDRFTKSSVHKAAVQALYTVFVKSDSPTGIDPAFAGTLEAGGVDRDQDYYLDSGIVQQLSPGEDVTLPSSGSPNSEYGPFTEVQLQIFSMAFRLPYEVVVKRFNSSFTASKAARLAAGRTYETDRDDIVEQYHDPSHREWMIDEVANQGLNLPGFFDNDRIMEAYLGHTWLAASQGQIDPVRETDAALKNIANGLSTHSIEAAKNGTVFENNVKALARENKLMADAGLTGSGPADNSTEDAALEAKVRGIIDEYK